MGVTIAAPNTGYYLKVSKDGYMQADGLEKFIGELNRLGGTLFQDAETKKVFEIKEIREDKQ